VELRSAFVFLALAACSSGRPKAIEDARKHEAPVVRDALPPLPSGPYRVDDGPKGDASVRVEWHDVPAVQRASAGRTACGTPRAPVAAPTVIWGIPDVFVVLATDHGKANAESTARVVLDHCALVPRVIVAGGTLAVASAMQRPAKLALTREGDVHQLDAIAAAATRPIMLPVTGHEVDVALEAGGVYQLAEGTDSETSWIVAATQPYTSITDATGVAILRDVPVGSYPVIAWLPARAGHEARIARGQVTVPASGLGEVTLDLTAQ
jgi:hypothetical protein